MTNTQRFLALSGAIGIGALSLAQSACLEDVCGDEPANTKAALTSAPDIERSRVLTLREALSRDNLVLSGEQSSALSRDGQLLGVVKLDRPVKHPNGTVEMPVGWLRPVPVGHPWARTLTPKDSAYFSFVEERILRAKLYDTSNPTHVEAVQRYMAKAKAGESFAGWTYAPRTECMKKPCEPKTSKACTDAGMPTEMPM